MTDNGATRDLARWLGLAAAPTFAVMAFLTGGAGVGAVDVCSTGQGLQLGGMAPMYLLMSAFHLPPWLRLASEWRA